MTPKIIQPDDVIPLGIVDTNHCGLPWPVTSSAEEIVGTISVIPRGSSGLLCSKIICDAIEGRCLTTDEIKERINNPDYDYYKKYDIDRDSVMPKRFVRACSYKKPNLLTTLFNYFK